MDWDGAEMSPDVIAGMGYGEMQDDPCGENEDEAQ